jgi:hypothetical protein
MEVNRVTAANNPLSAYKFSANALPEALNKSAVVPKFHYRQYHQNQLRNNSNIMAAQGPTAADATALFEGVQKKYPHKALGDDTWYMVVVSGQNILAGSC